MIGTKSKPSCCHRILYLSVFVFSTSAASAAQEPIKTTSEVPVAEPCGLRLLSSGMTRALITRAASGLKTLEFDRVFGASATSDDVLDELPKVH